MTGTSARNGLAKSVWFDRFLFMIDLVDDDLVVAEIGDEEKTVVGADARPVWVRGLLTIFVGTGSCVLDECYLLANGTILVEVKSRGRTSSILCGKGNAVLFIEADMTSTAVADWLRIDEGKVIVAIGVPGGNARLLDFADSVEAVAIVVQSNPTRSFDFGGKFGWSQFACAIVKSSLVDSLGTFSAGS